MGATARRTLLVLGVCLAWALTSAAPLWKYLSPAKAAAALLLGLLSIVLGMRWLDRLNREQRQIGTGWLPLLFLTLTALSYSLWALSRYEHLSGGTPNPIKSI
jgi:hypothetical protein